MYLFWTNNNLVTIFDKHNWIDTFYNLILKILQKKWTTTIELFDYTTVYIFELSHFMMYIKNQTITFYNVPI